MKKPRRTTTRLPIGETGSPDHMTISKPESALPESAVLDAIAQAIAPVEPPSDRRALMRQRILDQVRAGKRAQTAAPSRPVSSSSAANPEAGFVTVHPDAGNWQRAFPGVEMKLLHDHGDAQSFLLRLAPGASIPVHGHGSDELCVVLEGEVCLNGQVGRPGTFHLALADSEHMQVSSEHGCLLFLRANLEDGIRFR